MAGALVAARRPSTWLSLDPRTKMFMTVAISHVLVNAVYRGPIVWVVATLVAIPFVLSLAYGYVATVLKFLVFFVVATMLPVLLMAMSPGIIRQLLVTFVASISRLLPGMVMGYVLIKSTTVSEFIVAMQRMRVPSVITIPFSLMFRLFPAIGQEYRLISMAMKMRGIGGFLNPIAMLQYRLVPLLMVILTIGNELTVSAMSRGLDPSVRRSSVCVLRPGWPDALFGGVTLGCLVTYLWRSFQ